MHRLLVCPPVILALLGLQGCDNDCSYLEQCDGDTLLVCGQGPDQMFHREEHETDCTAMLVDGTCVELDNQEATCASEPLVECAPQDFEPRCEGDLLMGCQGVWYTEPVDYPTGYEAAVDCSADGRSCVEDAEGARCA